MNRYDTGGRDDEFEPGSNGLVLRNRLGITDPKEAEHIETELLIRAQLDSYSMLPISQKFDSELICALHHRWLGGLYPFAGQYRTVNVSKNFTTFCPAANISQEMERFEQKELSEHTPLRGLIFADYDSETERLAYSKMPFPKMRLRSTREVATKVAIVHAELILIHPFREGNGRLGRWIADLMAIQGGTAPPAYQLNSDEERDKYYLALRRAFINDYDPLTELFVSWIEGASWPQLLPPRD
ncbi:MAG: Fic family protein [Armatimonadota bacterium]